MEALMSPEELSEKLKIPVKTLAEWRSGGKGPAYLRTGRHCRYKVSDVEEWLTEQYARPREAVGGHG